LKTKSSLISVLKVIIPLGLGCFLIWYTYDGLNPEQRAELFDAFGRANLGWLLLSIVLGWLSHMSRAYRWSFLLEPIGYQTSFWNRYHTTMIGYFVNMLVPRAGEASRAVFLQNAEKVPFEKSFGTIIAERAVDLLMLGSIALITLGLQLDKLDVIQAKFRDFQATLNMDGGGVPLVKLIVAFIAVAVILGFVFHAGLRQKVIDLAKGVFDGVSSIWKTPKKGAFILHTFLIWGLYIAMFAVGFLSIEETASIPLAGIMAGFLGGSIGIILVQGGVGIYPPLVAIMISIYMVDVDPNELMDPAALALGWLVWVAQTLMLIVLGGLSLLLITRGKRYKHGTSGHTTDEP